MKTHPTATITTIATLLLLAASPCVTTAKEMEGRQPASGGKAPKEQPKSDSQKHFEKAKQHESKAADAADKGKTMEAIKEYRNALGELNKALEGSGKNQR
jgi:uncharacterized protein (DUF1800 family)